MSEGAQPRAGTRMELSDAEKAAIAKRLDDFEAHLQERTRHHLGYPYNLRFNCDQLKPFLQYSINNLGDPFNVSNYGVHSRSFELEVLNFFADLWKIEQGKFWGYVTTCGTEGNLLGLLYAREAMPEGTMFFSADSHYSVPKASRLYRFPCVEVASQETGEMNYGDFDKKLGAYLATGKQQVIVSINCGTTVRGAVDSLAQVKRTLAKHGRTLGKDVYIHCDGALAGLMLPFTAGVTDEYQINFELGVDSMSVSGHKMLGCPMPCGVVITKKEHMERWGREVEYLNSTDTTIMGSRNGQACIAMWLAIQRKRGREGMAREMQECYANAMYLNNQIRAVGIGSTLNQLSTTVVFDRPSKAVELKWQLACTGSIAHVVVMPSTSRAVLDEFVGELTADKEAMERQGTPPAADGGPGADAASAPASPGRKSTNL